MLHVPGLRAARLLREVLVVALEDLGAPSTAAGTGRSQSRRLMAQRNYFKSLQLYASLVLGKDKATG